jgi:Ca2+-binding EF-hand superfamily protein
MAATALTVPTAAMAQLTAAREQTFRDRDRNRDGVLTQEEYGGHVGNFRAMDANGDHVLSRDEFVNRYRDDATSGGSQPIPLPQPGQVDHFAMSDRNGDNVITRSEWRPELMTATFTQTDRNHDGVITRDEFRMTPLPIDSAEGRFGEMDRNNDGVLTRGEWRADPFSFNRADVNNDNRVSVAEYVNSPVGDTIGSRFQVLDRNRNGILNRNEWIGESLPFELVDRNGDNRITADEYLNPPASGAAERRFAVLDRNRNGILNRNEWRGESMNYDAVDRDNNNRITLEEYVDSVNYGSGYGTGSDLETRFVQYDRNRDGVLSRSEWRDNTADFRRADRNNDGWVTMREYLYGNVVYERPPDASGRTTRFNALDRNRNGFVTRGEWPYATLEFDRLDRNRDGVISRDEYLY